MSSADFSKRTYALLLSADTGPMWLANDDPLRFVSGGQLWKRCLSPVVLISPNLFEKSAILKIIHEAVVVNFFRFSSDGGAAFAGELDGFGDRFAGDNHGAVEDFPGVDVVRRLQGFLIVGAHRFGYRCFGFVGIFLDEINDFGKSCDRSLDDLRTIAQHLMASMKRAVDKWQVQIDQAIEHVIAFILGADVQRRRDRNRLYHVCRHRLITLALTAADGPDHHRVGWHTEFLYDGARKPVAQVSRAGDAQRFTPQVLRTLDFFPRDQHIRQLYQWEATSLASTPEASPG